MKIFYPPRSLPIVAALLACAAAFLVFTPPASAQDGMCFRCGFPANADASECRMCGDMLPNAGLKKNAGPGPACDVQIIPDSSKKAVDKIALGSLSRKELELARNEIYARHGWVFEREDLAEYFSYKSWYKAKAGPDGRKEANALIMGGLTPQEIRNIAAISRAEKLAAGENASEPSTSPLARPAGPGTETTAAVSVSKNDGGGAVVCVDPGHPSEVSDAASLQNGTTEVSVNWTVSKMVETELGKRGIKTVMTRDSFKKMTTNRRRAEIANEAGAALMLRLHCDTGSGSGITFYYPDRQGKVKNDVGPSADVIKSSGEAAKILDAAAVSALSGKLKTNGVKGDSKTLIGSRQGALTGSIYSRVPAVTVEMVYLSDKKDAEFIKSGEGLKLMADALVAGICDYLKSLGKEGNRK